jgi:hypothetical protein
MTLYFYARKNLQKALDRVFQKSPVRAAIYAPRISAETDRRRPRSPKKWKKALDRVFGKGPFPDHSQPREYYIETYFPWQKKSLETS